MADVSGCVNDVGLPGGGVADVSGSVGYLLGTPLCSRCLCQCILF